MKLLYCEHCHDIFTPGSNTVRSCECGRVKGRYINEREAEISPNAISIAISNKALLEAIEDMRLHLILTKGEAERDDYRKPHHGLIQGAWVRPNMGPGNPHTRLLSDEADRRDQTLPCDHMMRALVEHLAVQQEAAAIIRSVLGANDGSME